MAMASPPWNDHGDWMGKRVRQRRDTHGGALSVRGRGRATATGGGRNGAHTRLIGVEPHDRGDPDTVVKGHGAGRKAQRQQRRDRRDREQGHSDWRRHDCAGCAFRRCNRGFCEPASSAGVAISPRSVSSDELAPDPPCQSTSQHNTGI